MSHKLLFVDDEEKVQLALKRLFFSDKYEIYTASSGQEALKIIKDNPIDLIISDQRMPEMTGVDLFTEAMNIAPDAIRIILTGYADMDAAIGAINKGNVYKFIMKPWENDDLKLSVEKALEHYELIKENKRLNEELKIWNRTLEQRVIERTEELQEEKNKLLTFINTLREGFVFCDEEGTVVHVNHAAEKYFTVKLQDVIGKKLVDPAFTPVRENLEKYLLRFKENEGQKDLESNFKLNDRNWYNIRFTPVREDGKLIGIIMQLFTIKERYL
ncbi:MAG: response regulator [Candidatus Eremiobacterota bacterium]